ncbi:hypothetical protein E2562_034261 [Oryza meyeriana var. granulata]|uniref:Uncharacterized protein n=1 Tax=Oryza meyeriana var. granulata TaxID=110450 RepID=A0A6G1ESK4_9ORYZ|nr:hypothetical protein E2562_034261 [Oryza meyeriana var. granulata]
MVLGAVTVEEEAATTEERRGGGKGEEWQRQLLAEVAEGEREEGNKPTSSSTPAVETTARRVRRRGTRERDVVTKVPIQDGTPPVETRRVLASTLSPSRILLSTLISRSLHTLNCSLGAGSNATASFHHRMPLQRNLCTLCPQDPAANVFMYQRSS